MDVSIFTSNLNCIEHKTSITGASAAVDLRNGILLVLICGLIAARLIADFAAAGPGVVAGSVTAARGGASDLRALQGVARACADAV